MRRSSLDRTVLVACVGFVAVMTTAGCRRHTASAGRAAPSVATTPTAPPRIVPSVRSDVEGFPKPGWTRYRFEDALPFCVFKDLYEAGTARFLRDVKKTKLAAGSAVTFGVYPPWCVHPTCDQVPSLQCNVERDGNTLIIHSQWYGYHKDKSVCTADCYPFAASCSTAPLEAGTYTVKHGKESIELRIPGAVTQPCVQPKDAVEPP